MKIKDIPCLLCGRLVPCVLPSGDAVTALCSICAAKLRKERR